MTANTGKVVAEILLARKRPVRVIVRDEKKAAAWRERGAQVAPASLEDAAGLARALAGARPGGAPSRDAPRPHDQPGTMIRIKEASAQAPDRMPAVFLAHGSPLLLDDATWVEELHQWAQSMPRPKSVLMVSAHWEQRPVTLGATRTVPLVYDFYGFPERYYRVTYPAPGAPGLAARVRDLLGKTQPVADAPGRGLDHGAYVPLVALYPEADVPVLQVSRHTLQP
jgi:hypothetical protein